MEQEKKVILLAGPTASGKSKLALQLAKNLNGEIINADSMQVYNEIFILTSRPTLQDTNIVKHHLYGFNSVKQKFSAPDFGFDADVEFPPFSWQLGNVKYRTPISKYLSKTGILPKAFTERKIIDYSDLVNGMLKRPTVTWQRFNCVSPSWDNSSRRVKGGSIFINSTPEKYGEWLRQVILKTLDKKSTDDEKIVFINAWNEWAEGNHLEPDQKWGHDYLLMTQKMLSISHEKTNKPNTANLKEDIQAPYLTKLYWTFIEKLKKHLEFLK